MLYPDDPSARRGDTPMLGFSFGPFDWIALFVAIGISAYVATVKNSHPQGSDAYTALRVCRVGLALLAWSFGFGLIGFAFALAAFVLGIVGIVKGRGLYGAMLIAGSVVVPVISLFHTV